MNVTSKGQVTIPQSVRDNMGIIPSKTQIEFKQDKNNGRWYITKETPNKNKSSRFKTAHQKAKLTMSTEEIMSLTRS